MQPTDTQSSAPRKSKRGLFMIVALVAAIIIVAAIIVTVLIGKRSAEPQYTAVIQITSSGFVPDTLSVKPGTVITWKNTDTAPHQVASNPYPTNDGTPGLNSPSLLPGSGYTFTVPNNATDITYHDETNPSANGTIRVQK